MRVGWLALALTLLPAARASAEWQFRPFLGVVFGGETTLIDHENAAGARHAVVGVSAVVLGDVLGFDADVGYARGFFQSGAQYKIVGSSATTVTGNMVVTLPRRMTQYTLRPYFVGGVGFMHA